MRLVPVIGLETHLQLSTKTKMFCGCPNSDDAAPNTNICPICLGHPGTLPVPNQKAVEYAVLLGLALNGKITRRSKFDRKNYFYPDLPKAYQISQFDLPVMQNGSLEVDVPGAERKAFGIERLHLEEDAAKNIHAAGGKTLVDFNRGGAPLCEIVTKPDFTSAAEAKAYLQELRLIARTLGVSSADMEKGQMRCDVNVSLREVDEDGKPLSKKLSPKTEIKNVNSFRFIERAINYEIERQTKLWEAGTPPAITTTRGWNEAKGVTEEQRNKESSADYRYFPEPDVPPLELSKVASKVRKQLMELPAAKRERFAVEYGFKPEDARNLVENAGLANFAEAALSEFGAWLESRPGSNAQTMEADRLKLMKTFSTWLITKLPGLLEARKETVESMKLNAENFAEFVLLVAEGKITALKGLEVLERMLETGDEPDRIAEELGANVVQDASALETAIRSALDAHPKELERYRAGEEKLFSFFLGQVMKATKGNADPAIATEVLKKLLS